MLFRSQLRTARSNAARSAGPGSAEPQTAQQIGIAVTLKLCIPPDKKKRWQAAADTKNQELDEWLVSIADEATEEVLTPSSAEPPAASTWRQTIQASAIDSDTAAKTHEDRGNKHANNGHANGRNNHNGKVGQGLKVSH